MKKLIVILFAGLISVLGASPTFALTPEPTPEQCAESDTAPPGCPVGGDAYPLVLPEEGTVPLPEPTTPPVLPATGSSGVTGLLQVGVLLLTGGLIVAVAARRRKPDAPLPA